MILEVAAGVVIGLVLFIHGPALFWLVVGTLCTKTFWRIVGAIVALIGFTGLAAFTWGHPETLVAIGFAIGFIAFFWWALSTRPKPPDNPNN